MLSCILLSGAANNKRGLLLGLVRLFTSFWFGWFGIFFLLKIRINYFMKMTGYNFFDQAWSGGSVLLVM